VEAAPLFRMLATASTKAETVGHINNVYISNANRVLHESRGTGIDLPARSRLRPIVRDFQKFKKETVV
jgi:hypothetical protein